MTARRLKVIFFDAMGTLLDLRPWVTAMMEEFTQMSKRYGLKFENIISAWDTEWRRVNREVRTGSTEPFRTIRKLFFEAFESLGKENGLSLGSNEISATIERVCNYVNKNAVPYPDVSETLETLRKEGYRLALISDADQEDLIRQLGSAGLLELFERIITSSEARCYKPNTRMFEIALRQMRCGSNEACYVGDTPEFDIAGANKAGIVSILVTHGRKDVGARPPKPTYVIRETSEVIQILQQLR